MTLFLVCVKFIFLLFFTYVYMEEHEITMQLPIVDKILQKVCNISLGAFANASSGEKSVLLNTIEQKLNESANKLGSDGRRYVKLIMHTVKVLANNETNIVETTTTTEKLALFNNSMYNALRTKTVTNKSRDEIVKEIATKIESLGAHYLNEAKTAQDKREVLKTMKNKIVESVKQKHLMIHNKHDEMKSYTNLIAEGVHLMMEKQMVGLANGTRRINDESNDDSNIYADKNSDQKFIQSEIQPEYFRTNTLGNFRHISEDLPCDELRELTCSNIMILKNLNCNDNDGTIPLEKLCDGVTDCKDKSDELYCSVQAVERVRRASRVLADIESSTSRKCLRKYVNNLLLNQQNKVLRNVLDTQLDFIQKYNDVVASPRRRLDADDIMDKATIKKTVNEIAIVVSSLALVLEGALCTDLEKDYIEDLALRNKEIFDVDVAPSYKINTWSPKSCYCKNDLCALKVCNEDCKRICLQKFLLTRWFCKAISGDDSVSLDLLCDGKLDCYDESDEINCALGSNLAKFEASEMYNTVLDSVNTKTSSKEYEQVWNRLLKIHSLVNQLQKLSIKYYPDIPTIKELRDEYFLEIKFIYDDVLSRGSLDESDEVHLFLVSLNKKLIEAMKRSHTGNEKIISFGECFCLGSTCGLPSCSKNCRRACSVEQKLTKFVCDENSNKSISIEAICNKKIDCPNGNDEKGCSKEVCRVHHLVVLRHSIHNADYKHKGTALGEALKSWVTKVTATIKIAERNERPTPKYIKDIARNILKDLVSTYASLDNFRRSNNDYVLTQFVELSKIIIDTLKSCGK